MKRAITVIKIIIIITIITLAVPAKALAHCPLCAAGAGAGLTLSRLLGIDDAITGVWLAAFLAAMSFWTENSFIKDREVNFSSIYPTESCMRLRIWSVQTKF